MTNPAVIALRERARHVGTEAGRASATARGLDDWDAEALDAAVEAERLYLARHWDEVRAMVREGA